MDLFTIFVFMYSNFEQEVIRMFKCPPFDKVELTVLFWRYQLTSARNGQGQYIMKGFIAKMKWCSRICISNVEKASVPQDKRGIIL